jgi:glycosyltransferase involved in cell wall biosynthesis
MDPDISVIIPVKNGGAVFEECLVALSASQGADYEIIVLNDASTDNTEEIAKKFSCRLVALPSSLGPSTARNRGAEIARGEILFFIDADIIVRPDTLQKVSNIFQDRDVVASTGVLSEHIRYSNFSSHYKNLWMRYSYLEMPDKVSLFYTSVAAIRRELFLRTGGFDTAYKRPSVEDTDFGQRLEMMGGTVHLKKDLEVEHVKYYSLGGLLKTDFFRSADMIKMTLRKGLRHFLVGGNKTSVRSSFIAGVVLYCIVLMSILMGILFPAMLNVSIVLSGIFILSIYCLNHSFLRWLAVRGGWWFLVQSFLFIVLDLSVVVVGVLYGVGDYLRGNRY